MSMSEFGDASSPRRHTPVRPSHTLRGRRLLGVPWQAFELAFLENRLKTEEAFRRFCMFGRPAAEPMPGCAHPVRIGQHLYDAEALRNLYIAQSVGAAIQELLERARQMPDAPLRSHGQTGHGAAESVDLAVSNVRVAALRPLVRDALLIEICTARGKMVDLDPIGANLASLAFEVFLADPAPHELPRRLAEELANEGLIRRNVIEVLDRMEIYGAAHMGRAVVLNSLLPRWRSTRLRQSRAHGR